MTGYVPRRHRSIDESAIDALYKCRGRDEGSPNLVKEIFVGDVEDKIHNSARVVRSLERTDATRLALSLSGRAYRV